MMDELLEMLRDCLEGRRAYGEWKVWWREHAARVEAECGRYLYLRLEKRGLGCAHVILEEHGIEVAWRPGYCRQCGEPTFMARPGVTTVEEIREFGERCGDEEMVRSGWIHPGEFCATHGVIALWEFADRLPEVERSSVRWGWKTKFRLVASADLRVALEEWGVWAQYSEPEDIDTLVELGYDREVVRAAIEATGWSDDSWFPMPSRTPGGTFQYEVRRATFRTPDGWEVRGWVYNQGHAVMLLGRTGEWAMNARLMELSYERKRALILEDLGFAADAKLFPLEYWVEELGGRGVFPGEEMGEGGDQGETSGRGGGFMGEDGSRA